LRPHWIRATDPKEGIAPSPRAGSDDDVVVHEVQRIPDMGWLDGRRELYQPVPVAELAEPWPVIRACEDRLDLIIRFLSAQGLARCSYLDVGSCYGWFVARMLGHGHDARGIEIEPRAPVIGQVAYHLDPARIEVGECVELLERRQGVDVTSCLSLAHHFVLGSGNCSAEELIALLSRRTRRVLFFETGEDHEAWFRDSLRGWTPSIRARVAPAPRRLRRGHRPG
jgi:hypothetical protein